VNVWVSYKSLGIRVGEHASGCMYSRVGSWQSGRVLIGVDEGRVGKRAEVLSTSCRYVELHLSHLKKIASYVTSLVTETYSVSYNAGYRLHKEQISMQSQSKSNPFKCKT
jgi:hypothetical protein